MITFQSQCSGKERFTIKTEPHTLQGRLQTFSEAVNAWLIVACLLAAPLGQANEDDDRALFDACRKSDAAAVTDLLKKGASPRATDQRGRTPLMIAAMNGHTAVVRALLAAGADPKIKDRDGQTALALSLSMGQQETAAALTEADIGGNFDAVFGRLDELVNRGDLDSARKLVTSDSRLRLKGTFGRAALGVAVMNGKAGLAKFLIENGAYVNTTTRNMKTALMIAVEGGHLEIAKALLENGASVNAITETDDITALRLAEGKPQFEALLKKHGAVEKAYELNASYQQAVKAGDIDMVLVLLKKGADVNGSPWDQSPLVQAVVQNKAELIKILLANKADVIRGVGASLGKTALALYVENPKPDPAVIVKFVESGAPLDAGVVRATFDQFRPDPELVLTLLRNADVRSYFQDPIHSGQFVSWLAGTGRKDLMEALLAADFDPNWTDKFGVEGEPLIAKAALAGNPESVELLVAKGVSVNSSNRFGFAPIYLAALNGQSNVVKFLVEKNADTTPTFDMEVDADRARKYQTRGSHTLLMWSIEKGSSEISEKLLASGVSVNGRDGNGETALLYAARKQNAKLVQALLEKSADVKPRGKKGLSALMVACAMGNLDIVKLLLDKDAPINENSAEGATPLMLAAANGKVDVAKELITRKADVNVVTGEGEVTALTLARDKGHAEIAKMLKDAGAKELPPREAEKPVDYAKTTKAQWKERLRQLRYSPDSSPRRVPTEQQFKAIFGEPVRTQTVDLTAYWYYNCLDGTIQLKLVDPSQTRPQLVLDAVNDF